MVFLPEACDYVCQNPADAVRMSEPENGTLVTKYKALARQYDIWLSLGGIHIKVKEILTVGLVLNEVNLNDSFIL